MAWWKNQLIWRGLVTAIVIASVPPALVAASDALRSAECVTPVRALAKGDVVAADGLTPKRVRRHDVPHQRATVKGAAGKTAVRDLPAGACIAASSLATAPATFPFLLADVTLLGTPVKGRAVDLLFVPTNGQDSRAGASVEGAIVAEVGATRIVVEVTKAQQKTVLDLAGRSKVTVRAH